MGVIARTSLCMIVRNEEGHLDACLASVKGLFDEIVVVDTGSTDATKSIALAHGARVFDTPWRDDFSHARNESLRHARGRWIFWMDADERIPDVSRGPLGHLLRSLGNEDAAYLFRLMTPGPGGVATRDVLQVRLFKNDTRVRWEYPIHEQIGAAIERLDWEMRETGIPIVHIGYEVPGALPRKLERNLRILEKALAEDPENGTLLYHKATTLLDMGRAVESLLAFEACAPLVRGTTLSESIGGLRTRAYVMAGRLDEALATVRASLDAQPGDTALLYAEAELLAASGQLAAAEERLRDLLAKPAQHAAFANVDRTILAMRARSLLAEVLLAMHRPKDASVEARTVVTERPAFGQAWMALAEAALESDDKKALDDVCGTLARSAAMRPALEALRALDVSRQGRHDEARAILEKAMRAPALANHPVLLRAYAAVLHAGGAHGRDLEEAALAALGPAPLCVRTRAILREAQQQRAAE